MNIGKAIKILLVKKGMTQKEFDKETGLSESAISLLVKRDTLPRKETLETIASPVDVRPQFLMLLSINKDDPEDRRDLYDLVWPQKNWYLFPN